MPHPTEARTRRTARARSPGPQTAARRNGARPETAEKTCVALVRYTLAEQRREIVVYLTGGRGSLVIDRVAETHDDPRLLGELFPEEDLESARCLARDYLGRKPGQRRCCPYTGKVPKSRQRRLPKRLVDQDGNVYRVERVKRNTRWGADLRWVRVTPAAGDPQPVTLREVLTAMEDYEPAISMSEHAIATRPDDPPARLRRELDTIRDSTSVLNRRLREAVVAEAARGTSLAEIAKRSGHVAPNANGIDIGHTVWLAYRIGLSSAGNGAPQRWINQDLLKQIAAALSLAPAEVEL